MQNGSALICVEHSSFHGHLIDRTRTACRAALAAAAHLRGRQRAGRARRAHAACACTGTCCSCSRTTTCAARRTCKHYRLARAAAAHARHARSRLSRRSPVSAAAGARRARHQRPERAGACRRCSIASIDVVLPARRRRRRNRHAAARRPEAARPHRLGPRTRDTDAGPGTASDNRASRDRHRRRTAVFSAAGRSPSAGQPAAALAALDEAAGGAADAAAGVGVAALIPRKPGVRGRPQDDRDALRGLVPSGRRALDRHRGRRRRSVDRRGARRPRRRVLSAPPNTRWPASCATACRSSARTARAGASPGSRSIRSSARTTARPAVSRPKSPPPASCAGSSGASRRAISSRVQDAVKGDFAAITAAHVLDAARAGDGVAISVVRDTAKYLGMAAANLVVIADPDDARPRRDHGVGGRSAARAGARRARASRAAGDDASR